jgi:uncharacterized protein YdeI (YjbR/CyaY-like superfamily)
MPPHIVNQDRVKSFATEAAFEEWLAANHASAKEVWIKIYKAGSGVPTITPVQAIDVALCWGWIDGVRKALDETSFLQRYTPRKAKSVWTQINQSSVARLTATGRMTPHGQRHVNRAMADGRFNAGTAPMRDTTEATIPPDLRVAISADPRAFETFKRQRLQDLSELASRTNSMKTPAGRAKKITELVALLAAGGTLVPEQTVPKPTQPNPEPASLAMAEGLADPPKRPARAKIKPESKAAAAKRPAQAKAKPAKGKAAAAKRPAQAKPKPAKGKAAAAKRSAQAKAKPAKGKAAAAKRSAQAKAKPAKGKAAAAKRPAKATRAGKTSSLPKPPRKAKAKKATVSKKKAKRNKL